MASCSLNMASLKKPLTSLALMPTSLCEATAERYQNTVAQMYHDSIFELQSIFQDVYQVEVDTVPMIQASIDDYVSFAKELEALCDLIRPVDGQIKLMTLSVSDLFTHLLTNSFNNERAYDLLLQKKVLALLNDHEFSQRVWEYLKTDAEREDFLNRLFERVREIMGLSSETRLVFAAENSNDYYASLDRAHDTIFLYPALLGTKDRERIMRALFHEARHAYQWECVIDWYQVKWFGEGMPAMAHKDENDTIIRGYFPDDNYVTRHPYTSEETAAIWRDNYENQVPTKPRKPYLESPIEFDANSFAAIEENLRGLNPKEPGVWGEQ